MDHLKQVIPGSQANGLVGSVDAAQTTVRKGLAMDSAACILHAQLIISAASSLPARGIAGLYVQVLPGMGCVLPEDATLIAPNQLYGSLLSRVYTEEALRQTWWAAEAASASSAANTIAVTADDAVWAALEDGDDAGQHAWQRDVVFTGVSSRMHALLARLFTRCMWLGAAPTRMLMVQVVLGAAIDVRLP